MYYYTTAMMHLQILAGEEGELYTSRNKECEFALVDLMADSIQCMVDTSITNQIARTS